MHQSLLALKKLITELEILKVAQVDQKLWPFFSFDLVWITSHAVQVVVSALYQQLIQ